jgi:hypothetical protein
MQQPSDALAQAACDLDNSPVIEQVRLRDYRLSIVTRNMHAAASICDSSACCCCSVVLPGTLIATCMRH